MVVTVVQQKAVEIFLKGTGTLPPPLLHSQRALQRLMPHCLFVNLLSQSRKRTSDWKWFLPAAGGAGCFEASLFSPPRAAARSVAGAGAATADMLLWASVVLWVLSSYKNQKK